MTSRPWPVGSSSPPRKLGELLSQTGEGAFAKPLRCHARFRVWPLLVVGKTGGRSVANLSKHATLRPPVRRFRPVDRAQDRDRDLAHRYCPCGLLRSLHSRSPTAWAATRRSLGLICEGRNRLQAIVCLRGYRTPACRTPLIRRNRTGRPRRRRPPEASGSRPGSREGDATDYAGGARRGDKDFRASNEFKGLVEKGRKSVHALRNLRYGFGPSASGVDWAQSPSVALYLSHARGGKGARSAPPRYPFAATSAFSSLPMPSASTASEMVSGIRMRIVLAWTPQESSTRPSASAAAVTRLVASASGSSPPRDLHDVEGDHGARAADRRRSATVSLRCAMRARSPLILSPSVLARSISFSSAITSSTASAAAQATGLPA